MYTQTKISVDAIWSEWSDWSCLNHCERWNTKQRTRTCRLDGKNGGRLCSDDSALETGSEACHYDNQCPEECLQGT